MALNAMGGQAMVNQGDTNTPLHLCPDHVIGEKDADANARHRATASPKKS